MIDKESPHVKTATSHVPFERALHLLFTLQSIQVREHTILLENADIPTRLAEYVLEV